MALEDYQNNNDLYISTASEDGLDKYNEALSGNGQFANAFFSSPTPYIYQDGNTYGRPDFNQNDYAEQRPTDKIPVNHHDIMRESERVYEHIGLVRNIIDLMTDFTMQGIRVVHTSKSVEKFFNNWFTRIHGLDRSERFLNNLYKFGNVIVRRRWARLGKKIKREIRRANASTEDIQFENLVAPRNRIPSRYVFLNPSTVVLANEDVAKFVGGKQQYGVKFPPRYKKLYEKNPQDENIQRMLEQLPPDIKKGLLDNNPFNVYPLDPNDTLVFHFKKDDWKTWAKPIMYGVFQDINLLQKHKLADFSALDGATDALRIFKLGSLDHKIMPGPGAFSKLADLLKVNVGSGTRNIVWGPDIELVESKMDIVDFLGEDKYRPTLNAIYAGLGIPPTLTGTNEQGGTTNNLISLKTFIKKLEYGRQKLVEFWAGELELVRQSMNFQKAAVLEFDQNNLGDEEAEKRLFIELADRDIVSYEFVQRKFGLDPEVQSSKVSSEWKERDGDKRVPKASPFHRATFDEDVKKSLIDRGQVTPSEVGVELEEGEPGDTTNLEPQEPQESATPSENNGKKPPTQVKTNGRPPGKDDSEPRKSRRFAPVIKAKTLQEEIAETLTPVILQTFAKKNMRSLTTEETELAEQLKFSTFYHLLTQGREVNDENLAWASRQPFPKTAYADFLGVVSDIEGEVNKPLTFAEKRSIQVELLASSVS